MHCPLLTSSKLPDVGTTIFTVIGDLAAQHQALNLSQGAPSFPCDPALVEGAVTAMRAGHNQYAGMTGYAPLRTAVSAKYAALYGVEYDADSEVTVVASASQGLYAAITGLVHPGDEVIYFDPAFDSYAPLVRLQGAVPKAIKLTAEGFRIPWDEVRATIGPRTRMIILNTPHNPTATVLSAANLEELAALTRDTDIVVLSDEVYEHVVFDGGLHYGIARHRELAQRSVIVASFGKTYHVTGWRVGTCVAPAALTVEIRKIHQFMMFAADTPMQIAFAEQLTNPATYIGLGEFYQRKRDILIDGLRDSRFELLPSAGSFFLLARFRHFSPESDAEFASRLIREHRVATIPLSAFYSDGTDLGIIRLSFSKDDDTLREGARRLCAV